MNGTLSKSVIKNQVVICNTLRSKLYSILGISWPYNYDPVNDTMNLKFDQSLMKYSEYEFEKLFLSLGKCIDSTTKKIIPIITYRFSKKTSQGKVVMGQMNIDGAEFVVIIKANHITNNQKTMWIGDSKKIKIKTPKAIHQVISKSYMDAMCSVIMSRLVEKNKSPHFPLCYAASVNRVSFKRSRNKEDNYGTLCQSIWMEFLTKSMYEVLKDSTDVRIWWSAFFQVAAGLCIAQNLYGFIHNDLHSENVRVRLVPKSTNLYYKFDEDIIFEVPTFGFVFVIIDFGRGFIKPWENEEALASSVFGPHGECGTLICDNPSSDFVRLVASLEDTIHIISDVKDREQLFKFFQNVCKTDDDSDYFQLLKSSSGAKFNEMLESYPRKNCHQAIPKNIISMFYNMYKSDKIPDSVIPFQLK